jgi:hypothetical protein
MKYLSLFAIILFGFQATAQSGKLRTYTSEDWDYWEVSGSYSSLSVDAKMAMIFVPIFTSAIHMRGINK